MKNITPKILLISILCWLFVSSQVVAVSPKGLSLLSISSIPYPAKEANVSQIEYTDRYRDINIPAFWISRVDQPDRRILTPIGVKQFNDQTAYRKKIITLAKDFDTKYNSEWVKQKLKKLHTFISERAFYLEDGRAIDDGYLEKLQQNSHIDAIEDPIKIRYGVITEYAHQRIIPSNITLLKKPKQIYFDRNQNAALDIGTPVAVLHQSADTQWYFVTSETSYGWVETKNIALTTEDKMLSFSQSRQFVVTINPKNAIFVDENYYNFVRMGVRLPYVGRIGRYVQVKIPMRNNRGELKLKIATISYDDIHLGYLPYTPRTIITQAFKFLHAPYGWGGMFGEQDCSKYLQEIYSTVGIILPRNSSEQREAAKPLIDFRGDFQQRIDALRQRAEPASTLLYLPGHITLYLGSYDGKHYMIHTVWGAIEGKNPIAKTAVTTVEFKDYIQQMDSAISVK